MFKRFWAVFYARNLEFFRDRASLGWNLIFPVMLLAGFAVIFSDNDPTAYKVGIIDGNQAPSAFSQTKYIQFVQYADLAQAKNKLMQHQIDLLIDYPTQQYWVNELSSASYLVEKIMLSYDNGGASGLSRHLVRGRPIRYVDWVLPGVLAMNMMFSCLFGVGYAIVRYRKNSVLKRLQVTPLTAFEFIAAQICSRMFIVILVITSIFIGCNAIFDFYMIGSFINLFIIALLGAISLVSLGLLVACRSRSEELTSGLLNFASWPMMILSGVWFSLEGAPTAIKWIADLLPLTHIINAAREVMLEGASLVDIGYHLLALIIMSVVFIGCGSYWFSWQGDDR